MLKELEDVLVLVRLLPEKHQKEAAEALRCVVLSAEEQATMTRDEQFRLMQLRSKERLKRVAAISKRMKKMAKDWGTD